MNLDPRQQAILTSAMQAFATYGFRKTSMEDIAQGAGMSRPAVYLHYKNKVAIVRSLTEAHYQEKFQQVRDALSGDGSIPEILAHAMAAQSEGMAVLLSSPHGAELLDAGSSSAPDIVEEGEAKLSAIYADWLNREAEKDRVKLTGEASEIARTITSALKGVKMTLTDPATFDVRVSQLAALFGAGLEVR